MEGSETMAGYVKLIQWFGAPAAVACDAKCDKAWGISNRPREQLSDEEDDYTFLADDELETAPINPGTYEGDDAKPLPCDDKLNKWCVRECERCALFGHIEQNKGKIVELPDYSKRRPNFHARRT